MTPPDVRLRLETVRLTALYGRRAVVKDVSLLFGAHTVTAVIGPSGCGKSTFLRCLNRMHELSEGGWVTGRVLLDGADIYAAGSAWCFSAPRRFPPCRSTTMSPRDCG